MSTMQRFNVLHAHAGLPLEQVRAIPSIVATAASPKMSERYTFFSTWDLIQPLVNDGWAITTATQRSSRRRDPRFTRHMLRLRKLKVKPIVGDVYPEVVITNSHDGQSQWETFAGLYRLVCSNGLTVSMIDVARARIRHTGELAQALAKIEAAIEAAAGTGKLVTSMTKKTLAIPAQKKFARAAAELVYDNPDFDTSVLLEARRDEDKGDDVWRVYNRVQENIVRGGVTIQHQTSGRNATTRGLTHIRRSINVNLGLWDLAVKAAA